MIGWLGKLDGIFVTGIDVESSLFTFVDTCCDVTWSLGILSNSISKDLEYREYPTEFFNLIDTSELKNKWLRIFNFKVIFNNIIKLLVKRKIF